MTAKKLDSAQRRRPASNKDRLADDPVYLVPMELSTDYIAVSLERASLLGLEPRLVQKSKRK
ncbi:MAG TPA: hypothetical protein VF747_09215 [Blastocatellia bacterium]|jgi:hypothetical protein